MKSTLTKFSGDPPVQPGLGPVAATPAAGAPVGNYFVSAYPPFSTWEPSWISDVEAALGRNRPEEPLGLYLHLPFCQKKCHYCYYLSYAGQPASMIAAYLKALIHELSLYRLAPALEGRRASFIYFGGGTPSLLPPEEIRRLGSGLQEIFSWSGAEEVTFECAPRSTGPRTVEAMKEIGVTRASMGVQSFCDDLLRLNGRVHLVKDVLPAYRLIQEAGFNCVNLDLITGLLGETWAHWQHSVRQVIELAPESVTLYQLEIPHNTRIYRDWKGGELAGGLASWAEKGERLGYAFAELERAGYTVVSGYTAVKHPERTWFAYQDRLWKGGDMLGLGVASFSYLDGVHFQNLAGLEEYMAEVGKGNLPLRRARLLAQEERQVREFILGLKWGAVSRAEFERKFQTDILQSFEAPLRELDAEGFLTCTEKEVRLTRAGLLRVDALLPRFYLEEHRGVRYT